MFSITELWKQGGVTLISIVMLSILATVVLVERLLATSGIRENVRTVSDSLIKLIYQGDLQTARTQSQQVPFPLNRLFAAGLNRAVQGKSVAEAVERERLQLNQWLRGRLWVLGTIAAAAPFIGLFGTVVGIMQSFSDIAATGGGGFAVVSQGLSEALITTAAGIIVAVEAVVFYNFLQARLSTIAFSVRLVCEELCEVLQERKDANGDLRPTGS